MIPAGTIAISFVVAALATFALAGIAERASWVDAASDAPDRKRQVRPVPPVGGTALALALCVAMVVDPGSLPGFASVWTRAALATAFAVGLADDLLPRGLTPLAKLAGQTAAAVVFAVPAWNASAGEGVVVTAIAIAAQNALNTFDNADGAAAAVAACGFSLGNPVALAALLGFLPFNLWLGRSDARGAFTPRAYLGDSGSHLLAIALVATMPLGVAALALPALDLARVALMRMARRIPPWIGDRRHLAHRLQAAGLGRTAVVLALLAIAAPPIALGALGGERLFAAGLAITAVTFFAVVIATPTTS